MKSNVHKLATAYICATINKFGKLNLQDFVEAGMGKRTGSRYIKRFMEDNPGVIEYDASLKAYKKAGPRNS